jgi:hypothetical protein
MELFKSKRKYTTVPVSDTSVRLCFQRGFMPVNDCVYVDEYIIESSGIKKLIIIPEIETMSVNFINHIIDQFKNHFEENGELSGNTLQSMASWIIAWGLEMAWCWENDILDSIVFQQDMNSFNVPMSKFDLIPPQWSSTLIDSFLVWAFNNPGYTDRYEINIYDPIRDGYLTIIRCVVAKVMPHL